MNEKPYTCRHCRKPLGQSTDKSLSVGEVKIVQPVKLKCGHCGQSNTWRPLLAKIAIPVPAYPLY